MDEPSILRLWRERREDERRRFEAGEISESERYLERFFPDELLERVARVLVGFQEELRHVAFSADGFPDVIAALERAVVALNEVNDSFGGSAIETDEREELCAFLEDAMSERGIDVEGLAASRGCRPQELTDPWRTW